MAPRSKPRASKTKVASRSAAETVLREEILGRVFDWLEVEEITDSAAVCKQFDAALPRVTCLTSSNEEFQKGLGLFIFHRLSNVKHVQLNVELLDLKHFFANAALGAKELLSAELHIYGCYKLPLGGDDDGDDDDDEETSEETREEFRRDLLGVARALKRGCLSNLDHFTMSWVSLKSIYACCPTLVPALDVFYRALPARAAVAAVISNTQNADLLRRILDDNDLDLNAADSLGHTPLSIWCWNTNHIIDDDDSMASMFNELVSRGADVNQVRDGFSPCAMAAASGNKADVKLRLLLEAGARLSVGHRSPLPLLCHYRCRAASPSSCSALELLLKHGADVTTTSPEGETAMQLVTKHLESDQKYAKRNPLSAGPKRRIPLLQSTLIALGRATHKMLESARAEIDSMKQAGKRAAAAEPKTATRAKKKSRK